MFEYKNQRMSRESADTEPGERGLQCQETGPRRIEEGKGPEVSPEGGTERKADPREAPGNESREADCWNKEWKDAHETRAARAPLEKGHTR